MIILKLQNILQFIWIHLEIGESSLVNTNKLVRNYNGCTGLKTGSTSQALYNLSASATRDDFSLVAVVMKAPTSNLRFSNASTLLDYGFTNYEFKSLVHSQDIIQTVNVSKGVTSPINAIVETNCGTIIQKGNDVNIEQNIYIEQNLEAPISKGQNIGTLEYILNSETIAKSNLIASDDVDKIGLFSMNQKILTKWSNLLRDF